MNKNEITQKIDAIVKEYFFTVSRENWNLPPSTITEGNPAETFAGFALAAVILGGMDQKEIFLPIFKMLLISDGINFKVAKKIANEIIQKSSNKK